MTTIQPDIKERSIVSPAPDASGGIAVAGDVGANWFDFSKPASVATLIWDDTISSTDDFNPGKILIAFEATPNVDLQKELPRSLASVFSSVYLQMVFESLCYEIICSKGALTNAKLALAFIPEISPDELSQLSAAERRGLIDRQAEKVIFSPSPNASTTLNARWAHETNFVRTNKSMGTIVLMIYQRVVANIADGGSNEIHMSMRMAVNGLKLRYPSISDLIDPANDLTTELALFSPQYIPDEDYPDVPLPEASTETVVAPLLELLPGELVNEITPQNFVNLQSKEGEVAFMKIGYNDIFGLTNRNFYVTNTNPQHGQAYITRSHRVVVFLDRLQFQFPFDQVEGSEMGLMRLRAEDSLILYATRAGANLKCYFDGFTEEESNIRILDGNVIIDCKLVTPFEQDGQFLLDPPFYNQDINEPWLVRAAFTENRSIESLNVDNMPIIDNDQHAMVWSQLPSDTTPAIAVLEAAEGGGLPLIANLVNQIGASNAGRNPETFEADLVVGFGDSKRGFEELLGTVLGLAETFLPVVSMFLKNGTAAIVEATSGSPIHYVPTGGNSKPKTRNSAMRRTTVAAIDNAIRSARLKSTHIRNHIDAVRYCEWDL